MELRTIHVLSTLAIFAVMGTAGCTAASSQSGKGDVARGKAVFEKATCAVCHPGGGNTLDPKKPIKGPHFAKEFASDAALSNVIRKGVKGTAMPAFGKDQISDAEMKDLIAYIRCLK